MSDNGTIKVTFTCDLQERVYRALEAEAAASGRDVGQVVADRLSRGTPQALSSPEDPTQRADAFERHIGAWDSGEPDAADNVRIDADLAREYRDDHRRTA